MNANTQEQAAVVTTDAATAALAQIAAATNAVATKNEPSVWNDCKATVRNGLMIGGGVGIAVLVVTAAVCAASYIPRANSAS